MLYKRVALTLRRLLLSECCRVHLVTLIEDFDYCSYCFASFDRRKVSREIWIVAIIVSICLQYCRQEFCRFCGFSTVEFDFQRVIDRRDCVWSSWINVWSWNTIDACSSVDLLDIQRHTVASTSTTIVDGFGQNYNLSRSVLVFIHFILYYAIRQPKKHKNSKYIHLRLVHLYTHSTHIICKN